jgi:uncharacterized protein
MTDRSKDWFNQAQRDLEQAESSQAEGRHEWACFAAQQSVEKAVKVLHLFLKQEACRRPAFEWTSIDDSGRINWQGQSLGRFIHSNPLCHRAPGRRALEYAREILEFAGSQVAWPKWSGSGDAALDGRAGEGAAWVRLGYYGSYARGDWGVGSDLDVIAIVRKTAEPFERRSLGWDLNSLPVPADIIVYTLPEWEKLEQGHTRFFRKLGREAIWTFSAVGE